MLRMLLFERITRGSCLAVKKGTSVQTEHVSENLGSPAEESFKIDNRTFDEKHKRFFTFRYESKVENDITRLHLILF